MAKIKQKVTKKTRTRKGGSKTVKCNKYKKSETAIKDIFRAGDKILLRAAKMSATK